LITPPISLLSADSRKRLQAIEQFSDLGSGINIAMRDLDIRGAGDLLGADQSGFISDIGFDMYHKILNEAIQELKENEFQSVFAEENLNREHYVDDTVVETDFEILIPDEYVSSISERLALYKSLDDTNNEAELEDFRTSLIDRFGPIPEQTEALIHTIRLRWLAKDIGFEKIILKSGKMIGYFISKQDSPYYQSSKFSRVLQFMKMNPRACKMYEKNDSLRMSFNDINAIDEAINALQPITRMDVLA
jgi:transcription-repair coupling factor (superfamily II helicase)